MRISDIKVMLFSCPLPLEYSGDINAMRRLKLDSVIVKVETDDGIYGLGEPVPYGVPGTTESPEYLKAVIENDLRPRFLGMNPFDADLLTRPLGGDIIRTGYDRGIAGIDVALWDIMGKATGTPLFRLIEEEGNICTRLPLYASGGIHWRWKDRPEDLVDEAVRHKMDGFGAFKLRLGENWEEAGVTPAMCSALLQKVRAAVGPNYGLMVDANCRLRTIEDALSVGRGVDAIGGLWFEEPMYPDAATYAHLADSLETPIAGGEGWSTLQKVYPFLELNGFEVVQTDPGIAGVSTTKRIARAAQKAGRLFAPHCWTNGIALTTSAHLMAAFANRLFLEYPSSYNPMMSGLLKNPLNIEEGYLLLSETPGLGVDLAEDAAERFPFIPGPQMVHA